MRADHLLPHGWLDRYRWALQNYDLIPFWYPTQWDDVPLAAGSAGSVSIQIGDDYWWYQLGIAGQVEYLEEQPPLARVKMPGLEIMVRIDGNPVFGDFTPAILWIGGSQAQGLGPGWILRRGSIVTIDWRRPVVAETEIQEEQVQFLLHGSQLGRRGSATYGSHNWRNMTLTDFDRRAMLQPMCYTAYGELNSAANSNVTIEAHIRDRHFILRSIRSFLYDVDDDTESGPLVGPGIPAMRLLDQGGSWHPQTEQMASTALHGDPVHMPYDLRIPRIVPANRTIQVIAESYPWAAEDPAIDQRVGVQFWGYEIIGDRRGKAPPPDPIEEVPFRYRPGGR